MDEKQRILSSLPSVDEILRREQGKIWLKIYPRRYIIQAVREVLDSKRKEILEGKTYNISEESMMAEIENTAERLSSYSLKPLINATGIIIHTNLGRSLLSEKALENIKKVSLNYSNLEYDLKAGKRGKRYTHVLRVLKEVTEAEDALVVNNNAAAVFLCLNTLSKGKESIVSRGELVEIGGSFRMPEVMSASGAILREVGTTNKTNIYDYERAINDNTALIVKVHKSNFKVSGFVEEVSIEELVTLGRRYQIPVMFDLGSGCLIDLKPFGIHDEPVVRNIVKAGADLTTFSGDKLLGGPQGGVIVGKKEYIEKIQKNPLTRAMRIDKLTLAGLEATLMEYIDEDKAIENIPTLKMLLQKPEKIREKAKRIAKKLRKEVKDIWINVMPDTSRAGGGSLPELDFPTYVVAIRSDNISINEIEERLRNGNPPIISRIKEGFLILDARTIRTQDIDALVKGIKSAFST